MSNKNIEKVQTLTQDIKQLTRNLSKELEPLYGSAYSVRQPELMRQFYGVFSNTNALRSQLNWTQYKLSIQINGEK